MLSRRIASRLRDMETPFYLYDTELLRQTLESVVNESKRYNYKVHYAIKANYDDRLLAIIREYGLGVDCASGNEVQKAIEAGFDPKSIVYAGVGKRDKELRYAIEQEIMAINCESIEELLVLDAMAAEAGRTVEVALRVNPDIDPKTNHCIDTGQADSKFGISYEEILDNAERIRSLKHLRIVGVHLHIGSQIRELHVFENMWAFRFVSSTWAAVWASTTTCPKTSRSPTSRRCSPSSTTICGSATARCISNSAGRSSASAANSSRACCSTRRPPRGASC